MTAHTPTIINNPTQENTNFIYTANDKPIKQLLFGKQAPESHTTLYINFSDLIKLQNMNHEIREETYRKNSIGKIIHKTLNSTFLVQALTFLAVILIVGLYGKSLTSIAPFFRENLLFPSIAVSVTTVTAICGMAYALSTGACMYETMKHRNVLPYISKEQKARLKTIPVACMDSENLEPCNESLNRVHSATKSMIRLHEESRKYNIDMSRFTQADEDYAKVLIFVYANKDNISKDLFEKYVKELDVLADIVVEEAHTIRHEVREINQAVATELKDSKTFEKELAAIRQEEADTAATVAMPLRWG